MGFKARSLGAKMARLAGELAAENDGLDFSLKSLARLEEIITANRSERAESLWRWAAYLGESVRRVVGGTATWVDYKTAAASTGSIATLGYGPDLDAILSAGSSSVFPLVKIEKFLANGAIDSPAAFAPIAVMMMTPAPKALPRALITDRSSITSGWATQAIRSFDRFFADPSARTLPSLGYVRERLKTDEIAFLLRECGAKPAILYPLLAEPPRKKRDYFGFEAARWISDIVAVGLGEVMHVAAELGAMAESDDADLRTNASSALGRVLAVHLPSRLAPTFEAGDRVVQTQLVEAFDFVVYEAREDKRVLDSIEPHLEFLKLAIASPAHRTLALETTHQISRWTDASIRGLLPSLLLALETGKPAQIEQALIALDLHVSRDGYSDAIVPLVAPIIRHTRTLPGKVKRTKVQIAADAARFELARIAEHLPARERKAVLSAKKP